MNGIGLSVVCVLMALLGAMYLYIISVAIGDPFSLMMYGGMR